MTDWELRRALRPLVSIACVVIAWSGVAPASDVAPPTRIRRADPAAIEIEGRLVDARGRAVAEAVVVTQLGGRALSLPDGSFRLELALDAPISDLRVTAVAGSGAASLVGSTLLPAVLFGSPTAAGTIVMELGSGCDPSWLPSFGRFAGYLDNSVQVACTFDDGAGHALYVGGDFLAAGSTSAARIARWNGQRFTPLGSGVDGRVYALAVYDDGSGPLLYVGGDFNVAGGTGSRGLATWNGSSWSTVGAVGGSVQALEVFDDGDGPALYVAGSFTLAGGVAANNIAKWDGSTWSALGAGLDDGASALTRWDDGDGESLFVGGSFTTAGAVSANRIAEWNGSSWRELSSGLEGGASTTLVSALCPYEDGSGSGSRLYAAGRFALAGGVAAERIAAWDGTSWADVGGIQHVGPYITHVHALRVHDDGSGPFLYAGGIFRSAGGVQVENLARWDGASWAPVPSGVGVAGSAFVLDLEEYDDGLGAGPALLVAGKFVFAGGHLSPNLARWTGSAWRPLGYTLNDDVAALAVFDDGTGGGPALYAGGRFGQAGGTFASRVARWDGSSWSPLGNLNGRVNALAVYADAFGGDPALFAGGDFTSPPRLAKWDGSAWVGPAQGPDDEVLALAVFDPPGPQKARLYVAGLFRDVGAAEMNHVAAWDGASWSNLRSGWNDTVRALAVFDDGGGPSLYVGGGFTNNADISASRVAKWDGLNWFALGTGVDGDVHALQAFDDGTGTALYAGGAFLNAGGSPAQRIARWDGSNWAALGSGIEATSLSVVRALTAVTDSSTGLRVLYVGGRFTGAGGVSAAHVARWDGASWSALGSGVQSEVLALVGFDDRQGGGIALYAGGAFDPAFDSNDSFLARFGLVPPCGLPGLAYCSGDGTATACPCGNSGDAGAGCANSTGNGAVLAAHGSASVANDTLAVAGSRLIAGQPALLFQGTTAVNGGQGVSFGDGLRCAGGAVIRIDVLFADFVGEVAYPGPNDAPLSIAGAVQAGDTRRYQLWYRDPSIGPCGSGFNLTNGYQIVWQ